MSSKPSRVVAIDSAGDGEVEEIAKRCADVEVLSIDTEEQDKAFERSIFLAPKDRATLLAIVQRQAGEIADMLRRPAESRALRAEIERDAARAEVESLKACPSHRSNLPVAVVGCSECIACLRIDQKWTKERVRQERDETNEHRNTTEVLKQQIDLLREGLKLQRAVTFPGERQDDQSPGEARWSADEWMRQHGHLIVD
jgi:hypothetical protein